MAQRFTAAITIVFLSAASAAGGRTDPPQIASLLRLVSSNLIVALMTQATVKKANESDLTVGLICADRDGNRIRIDHVDRAAATLSYHFLNDELRVQEGIQERSIDQFLAEGWYIAVPGKSL
jgi:hypothetical protein